MTKRLDIDALEARAADATDLVAQLDAARARLDRSTDTLELIAAIKEDLRRNIRWRQLKMEALDANVDISDLLEAVEDFKRIVAYLTWRSP
jgi:hypothetical protein